MGWPRRRRAQQQRLRRQISAAKNLLLAHDSAPVETLTKKQVTLAPPLKKQQPLPQHQQQLESSASKWYYAASPRKAAAAALAAGGHHRHRGLREKFYSVDSLAETEPEDDDDEDETESEGSEGGTPHHHQHHQHHHVVLKTEPVIPEEKEPTTTTANVSPASKILPQIDDELVETTGDEEDRCSSSETKPSPPVPSPAAAPAAAGVMETHKVETDVQEISSEPLYSSSVEFEVTGVVVDGEDTESEDEAVDDVLSSSTITIEEDTNSAFVAENSPVVELEEAPSTSTSINSNSSEVDLAENSEPKQHQPFLFPPPYFPGDLDEYESDIYETLLRREKTHHVTTDYFSFQSHVTLVMRSMLIDWLVEVHNHFNLQPDTLYLTVNYIDRFLATVPVKRENFQLVALTALLIASKFEEVHPVDIEDLVYICERSYTAQQIVQFEKQMLAALQFNLVVPTCSGFLEYYVDKLSVELMVAQLANFFSEQTLLDFHLSAKYVPSVVASSALLLAQCYAERAKPELSWVLEFEETTGYYAKDIWCCVRDLSDMLSSLSFDLVAVRTKFRSSRFGRVADLPHLNVSTMVIE